MPPSAILAQLRLNATASGELYLPGLGGGVVVGEGFRGARYGSWGSDRISMSPFSPFNKHAEDLSQRSMGSEDVGVQSPLRSAHIQLQADFN